MKENYVYALIDNKMNMCWAFQKSKQEIEEILELQKDPSCYRIELVKEEDFFDKNGTLIRQSYR